MGITSLNLIEMEKLCLLIKQNDVLSIQKNNTRAFSGISNIKMGITTL